MKTFRVEMYKAGSGYNEGDVLFSFEASGLSFTGDLVSPLDGNVVAFKLAPNQRIVEVREYSATVAQRAAKLRANKFCGECGRKR